MMVAVIPAYRAGNTIAGVLDSVLPFVNAAVVVDDCCPEGTGDVVEAITLRDERVSLIRHDVNGGVGAAMKTGFAAALSMQADVVVKVDADGQMDPSFIPRLVEILDTYPAIALVKGNRFGNSAVLTRMPPLRLFGNSGLSFIVKVCSGYWNVIDPTNGYIAISADALRAIDYAHLADRYFFEIDLLCELGLRKAPIAELEMAPIYAGENSSLSIGKALLGFPVPLAKRFLRRLWSQYFLTDINVGTIYGITGWPLLLIGTAFGIWQWYISYASATPRTTGTVVLALLLFIVGFQLVLQAITYDVQFSPRTLKARLVHHALTMTSTYESSVVVVGHDRD